MRLRDRHLDDRRCDCYVVDRGGEPSIRRRAAHLAAVPRCRRAARRAGAARWTRASRGRRRADAVFTADRPRAPAPGDPAAASRRSAGRRACSAFPRPRPCRAACAAPAIARWLVARRRRRAVARRALAGVSCRTCSAPATPARAAAGRGAVARRRSRGGAAADDRPLDDTPAERGRSRARPSGHAPELRARSTR